VITLPLPPSANRYWRAIGRGRVLVSEEGRAFKKMASLAYIAQRRQYHDGDVKVKGYVYFENRRRDLDNVLKPLLDALADGVAYRNDRQVRHIDIVARIDRDNPRVEIEITPLN